MRRNLYIVLLIVPLVVAVIFWIGSGPTTPTAQAAPPDVVISAEGCSQSAITLTSESQHQVHVRNDASETMVLSLPDIDAALTVEPRQQATLQLQPSFWGSVTFFCVTKTAHDQVDTRSANALFVCGLDSFTVRRVALSEGTLKVPQAS